MSSIYAYNGEAVRGKICLHSEDGCVFPQGSFRLPPQNSAGRRRTNEIFLSTNRIYIWIHKEIGLFVSITTESE